MDRLRALGARYIACDRFDRIALGLCALLAVCAIVAVAGSSVSGEATADAAATGLSSPVTGLELSTQLAAERLPVARPDRRAVATMPTLEPAGSGTAGLTLLLALPVGACLGFVLARQRDAAAALPAGTATAGVATSEAAAREVDHLRRSLGRRDRRIAALKKRLRSTGGDEVMTGTGGVGQLERELDEAHEAIRRLEELLQDKQDDWARSELITARSDSRVAALEADLRAAGEIIESLHEDIGYWKRRAVDSAPRDRVVKRLTG